MEKETKKKIAAGMLLTPLLLSVSTLSVKAGEFNYSHEMQGNLDADDAVVANTMNSTTWNGTQTFNYKGDPVDADNDTDADPYG